MLHSSGLAQLDAKRIEIKVPVDNESDKD